jgi:RNA polymerase sigma factor (sigma-70 family)
MAANAAPSALVQNPASRPAAVHPKHNGRRLISPAAKLTMTETTFTALLDLRRRFLSFLERRVDNRAIAEDILQSAYLRALEAKGRLREDESALAWFYRILRNAVIDHYRRRTTEGAALEHWALALENSSVPEPQLQETTCQCIAGALDVIAPAYASLLRAVDLKEGSLADYASAQGITPGNAAVRAHRARAALRRQLIRCCGTCAEHGCIECKCRIAAVTS